jgi:DNA-binding LacI/PurR family transcriptional regulator
LGRPDHPRGLDVVDFDTRRSAELLVDELAATGHRHIAVLGEPADEPESLRFLMDFNDGARQRAAAHGIGLDIVARPSEGWDGILACADRLLAHRDDRLGLIGRTPRLTDWLVRLLQLRRLVPGQDVSLAGLCTDDVALSYHRPVTNVSPGRARCRAWRCACSSNGSTARTTHRTCNSSNPRAWCAAPRRSCSANRAEPWFPSGNK